MIQAKKRFGQVFLQDRRYIDSLLRSVPRIPEGALLEIGPGPGVITAGLAEKARKVIAVEIDRDMVRLLKEKFSGNPKIEIIQADFLKWDLTGLEKKEGPLVVVGNLPYNVASMILLKLVECRDRVREAYVMVQREVGDRITSAPGRKQYSFLTVAVSTFAEAKRLFVLPPGAFRPAPKVESAFLRLSMDRPDAGITDTRKYLDLVSRAFSQRRKMVINVLGKYYPRDLLERFFLEHGIDEKARAESLPVETFVALYRAIHA
jgi:16S rRNA (adenine1518-N6/adenine1519-N6)-dimethyltransferase